MGQRRYLILSPGYRPQSVEDGDRAFLIANRRATALLISLVHKDRNEGIARLSEEASRLHQEMAARACQHEPGPDAVPQGTLITLGLLPQARAALQAAVNWNSELMVVVTQTTARVSPDGDPIDIPEAEALAMAVMDGALSTGGSTSPESIVAALRETALLRVTSSIEHDVQSLWRRTRLPSDQDTPFASIDAGLEMRTTLAHTRDLQEACRLLLMAYRDIQDQAGASYCDGVLDELSALISATIAELALIETQLIAETRSMAERRDSQIRDAAFALAFAALFVAAVPYAAPTMPATEWHYRTAIVVVGASLAGALGWLISRGMRGNAWAVRRWRGK